MVESRAKDRCLRQVVGRDVEVEFRNIPHQRGREFLELFVGSHLPEASISGENKTERLHERGRPL